MNEDGKVSAANATAVSSVPVRNTTQNPSSELERDRDRQLRSYYKPRPPGHYSQHPQYTNRMYAPTNSRSGVPPRNLEPRNSPATSKNMATRNKDPVSTQPQTSSLSNSGFWKCPDCGSNNKSLNKACFSLECSYSVPTEAKKKKKNKSKKKDDTTPKDQKEETRAVEKYDQVDKTRVERLRIKSVGDQNPSIKSAVQDLSSLNLEAKAQPPPISVVKDKMSPNTTRQNLKAFSSEKQNLNVKHLKAAKIREAFSLQQPEAKVQEDQQHNLVKTNSLVKENQQPVVPRQAEIEGDKDPSIVHEDKDKHEDVIHQLKSIRQHDSHVQFVQKPDVQGIKAGIEIEQESAPQCTNPDMDGHEESIIKPLEAEVVKEQESAPQCTNPDMDGHEESVTKSLEAEVVKEQEPKSDVDKTIIQYFEAEVIIEQESTLQCTKPDMDGHDKPIIQPFEAEVLKEQESTKHCPQSYLDGHEEPIIQPYEAEVDEENGLQPVDGIAVSNQMTNLNDECRTSCSSVASELELQEFLSNEEKCVKEAEIHIYHKKMSVLTCQKNKLVLTLNTDSSLLPVLVPYLSLPVVLNGQLVKNLDHHIFKQFTDVTCVYNNCICCSGLEEIDPIALLLADNPTINGEEASKVVEKCTEGSVFMKTSSNRIVEFEASTCQQDGPKFLVWGTENMDNKSQECLEGLICISLPIDTGLPTDKEDILELESEKLDTVEFKISNITNQNLEDYTLKNAEPLIEKSELEDSIPELLEDIGTENLELNNKEELNNKGGLISLVDLKNQGDLKIPGDLKNPGDLKYPGDLMNSGDLKKSGDLMNPEDLKKSPIKAVNSEVQIKSVRLVKPKVQNIPLKLVNPLVQNIPENAVDPEVQIKTMKLVTPEVEINPVMLSNPEVQINPMKLVNPEVQNNAVKLRSPEAKISSEKELNLEVQKKSLNDEVLINPDKMVDPQVQKIQSKTVNSKVQENPFTLVNPEAQINPIEKINPEVVMENFVKQTDPKVQIDLDNPVIPDDKNKQSGGNESQKQMHLLEANILKSLEQHGNSKHDSSLYETKPLTAMSVVEQSSPVGSQSVNNSDACLMELLQDSQGQYLYALCEEDGVWYRVTDVYKNYEDTFTVLMIDYGTYITVHEQNIVFHVEDIPADVDMDEYVIQDLMDYENEDDLYDYDGVPYEDGKRLSGASEENQILPESTLGDVMLPEASNQMLKQDSYFIEPIHNASQEVFLRPITNKPASNTLLDQDIFHGEPDEWSPVPIEYSIRPYASEIRSMVPSYQEFVQDCKQRDTHRFEDLKYSTSVNTVAENPGKSLKTDVYVPYKRTRANKNSFPSLSLNSEQAIINVTRETQDYFNRAEETKEFMSKEMNSRPGNGKEDGEQPGSMMDHNRRGEREFEKSQKPYRSARFSPKECAFDILNEVKAPAVKAPKPKRVLKKTRSLCSVVEPLDPILETTEEYKIAQELMLNSEKDTQDVSFSQDVTVTDSLGASSFSSVQSDEDYALLLGNNSRGSTSTPMDSGIFEPVFLESQLATAEPVFTAMEEILEFIGFTPSKINSTLQEFYQSKIKK